MNLCCARVAHKTSNNQRYRWNAVADALRRQVYNQTPLRQISDRVKKKKKTLAYIQAGDSDRV